MDGPCKQRYAADGKLRPARYRARRGSLGRLEVALSPSLGCWHKVPTFFLTRESPWLSPGNLPAFPDTLHTIGRASKKPPHNAAHSALLCSQKESATGQVTRTAYQHFWLPAFGAPLRISGCWCIMQVFLRNADPRDLLGFFDTWMQFRPLT